MIFSSPGLRKHTCDRLKHTWSGCGCELWTHVCRRPLDLALAWSCINIHKPHFKHCFSSERADRPRVSGAVRGILDKESRDRVCVCVSVPPLPHLETGPVVSIPFLKNPKPNRPHLDVIQQHSPGPSQSRRKGETRAWPIRSGVSRLTGRREFKHSAVQERVALARICSSIKARKTDPTKQN